MAFIGVVVGAGFASGQEAMQYFVAFGNWGLWGIALAAGLMMITGVSILPVSYTHLTLPTTRLVCRSRWSPDH